MYEQHFGLLGKPFQSRSTESSFFRSQSVDETLPTVLHTLRSDMGIAVLTGPSGIGKTAFLKYLQQILRKEARVVLASPAAISTETELYGLLYRAIIAEENQQPVESTERITVERWQLLQQLGRSSSLWGPVILLLDDAHLMDERLFNVLRSLLEEEVSNRRLLRLMIAGPLNLEEVLARPAVSDFAARIRSHSFLETLRSRESIDYLTAQFQIVGAELPTIFQPSAVEKIVVAADGLPRNLNLLVDECLIVGCEQEVNPVTEDIVNKALKRLQHLPYSWNISVSSDYADSPDEDFSDDSDAPASPSVEVGVVDSVVEISSPGVIEIGAGPESNSESNNIVEVSTYTEVTDDEHGSQEQSGVFEIGSAPAVDHEFAETIEEQEPSSDVERPIEYVSFGRSDDIDQWDTEAEQLNSDDLQEVGSDEFALDNRGFLNPESVETELIEAAEEEALTNAELEEISDSSPSNEDTDKQIEPALDGFEPWVPPGTWSSLEPKRYRRDDGWLRLPKSVTPMPVFDRYTWRELGRDTVHGHTSWQIPILTTDDVVVWPAELEGVVPVSQIPIVDEEPEAIATWFTSADGTLSDAELSPEASVEAPEVSPTIAGDEEQHTTFEVEQPQSEAEPIDGESDDAPPCFIDDISLPETAETISDDENLSIASSGIEKEANTTHYAEDPVQSDETIEIKHPPQPEPVTVAETPAENVAAVWDDGKLLDVYRADEALSRELDQTDVTSDTEADTKLHTVTQESETACDSSEQLETDTPVAEPIRLAADATEDVHASGEPTPSEALPEIGQTLFTLPILIDELVPGTVKRPSKDQHVAPLADSVREIQEDIDHFRNTGNSSGDVSGRSAGNQEIAVDQTGPQYPQFRSESEGSGPRQSLQAEESQTYRIVQDDSQPEIVPETQRQIRVVTSGLRLAAGAERMADKTAIEKASSSPEPVDSQQEGVCRRRISAADRLALEVSILNSRRKSGKKR